jgi:Tol biopolymer transport system component
MLALVTAAALMAADSEPARVMMEAARKKEVVDGDLHGAIKQYSAIVAKFKNDRAVAAMALVRMAECYQKMGDAEARKIYEQVVKDYADQPDAVAEARTHMGAAAAKAGRQMNTLVWTGGKVDAEGGISPDGRYISFTDWDTGDLAIHEVASGEDRMLTHTGNVKGRPLKTYAEESAISRDGKQVAFSWFNADTKRYELHIAGLAGEPKPHMLYDDAGNDWLGVCDWSPDGRLIAVLVGRPDRTKRLGVVSTADGSFRVLSHGIWPGETHAYFSPDGKYVGYDVPDGAVPEPRDLYVYSLESGRDIPVAVRPGEDYMMGWSPDGRLLFASDRNGSLGLWAYVWADGKPQGPPQLLKNDLGADRSIGLTQSGTLYYSAEPTASGRHIRIVEFDFATGRISTPRDLPKDFPESQMSPYWSADGKYLAYQVNRGSGPRVISAIVIRSAETFQVVHELPNKLQGISGWTPDGKSIYAVGSQEGRTGTYRLDIETGAVSPLALDEPGETRMNYLNLSSDGKRLYFARRYTNPERYALFERDLATGRQRELIRRSFLTGPNVSPDGKYIATMSIDEASHSRIVLLIPVGGGEPQAVMREPSQAERSDLRLNFVMWKPDSSMFLVRRVAGEAANEFWTIPVSGGSPRKLDTRASEIGFVMPNPDGRRIAYVVPEPAGSPTKVQIWALENFLPASK